MVQKANQLLPVLIKNPFVIIDFFMTRLGKKKQCYICKKKFNRFSKYSIYINSPKEYIDKLQLTGSSEKNYGCVFCHSNDRLRHLFMYFDKLNIWEKLQESKILHFAPEPHLVEVIQKYKPGTYILADFMPQDPAVQKIDITNIPLGNSCIDILICNHVLEHVTDYLTAIREVFRILKPGGFAIIQTPYSKLLKGNFEDENINNEELRAFFYSQKDHVRVFSEEQFFKEIRNCGFILNIFKHNALFSPDEACKYGVNENEDLIMVNKPFC